MRRPRSPRRHRPRPRPFAGQSIVEFALISLVLFMMTFGILDFGRAVMTRAMLTNAIREAARYGIVGERSLATIGPGTNCFSDSYCDRIVQAAQRRSPSLGLTAAHFRNASTGEIWIGCRTWETTVTSTAFWTTSNDGTLVACIPPSAANVGVGVGGRLTVCAQYDLGLIAPRLLRMDTIRMRECARVPLQ